MCYVFICWWGGVPRWPDPEKITTTNLNPHKVLCGKSSSWDWKVRGQGGPPPLLPLGWSKKKQKSESTLAYMRGPGFIFVLRTRLQPLFVWDAAGKGTLYVEGSLEGNQMKLYLVTSCRGVRGGGLNTGPQLMATRCPSFPTSCEKKRFHRFPAFPLFLVTSILNWINMFHMFFLLLLLFTDAAGWHSCFWRNSFPIWKFGRFFKKKFLQVTLTSKSLSPVTQTSSTSCYFDATRSRVPTCGLLLIDSEKEERASTDILLITHIHAENPEGHDSGHTRAEVMRSGGSAPVPQRGHKEANRSLDLSVQTQK